MPENRYIQQVPTDWLGVTGNTWQITGLQVVNPSANLVHIDSTTGRASGFYYNELGAASTGVYAASGQFSTPDPVVAWGLVHPANNEIITENYAQDPFFQGFEISILDRDGTVKTGLGSIDDGRISQVELVSGGSGYMNPTVFVSGDGTGAKIEIETFGTGLFTEISGYSLSTSGVSGYQTGIASIKIISGGSGYTAGNTHLVISGSGNDEYTIGQLATISQGGDAQSNQGSGAFVTIPSTGFGLKKFYYDNSFVQIPISVNREVFGGDGERDFQVQVVARDYYSNLTTGRIQLSFPAPRFENFEPIKTSNEIIFGVTASGRIEQDKDFLENSLQKLEIHRGPTSDFSVVTGSDISNTKIFTQEFIENQSQGLSEITLTSDLFDDSDYYSGYFYKLLPYDNFGTGDILSIETGIRISRNTEIVDVPSGFRTLVDQSKGVGTNIQGDVITNTYLSWKKDKRFNIEQYEVVVEDQVEQESYTATVAVPQVSGINYIVSGTGSGRADFDQDSLVQLKTDTLERTVFDVFQPYSSNGVQWSAHTVYLDSEYLGNVDVQSIGPTSIRESVERPFVEVAAGNSASGYLYYTGVGDSISYAGADSFLSVGDQQEPHALVARNVNGEVIVEYEPRIKIPTKKDGSYSFKVRGITNKGEKSLYGETQTFTASGAKSHFSFNPTNTNLELGGTGTIVSSGPFVTTVGGKNITAVGTGVVLVGGMDNSVTGEMSALVGGSGNRLMGAEGPPAEASFMGGGRLNVISGFKNVLVGGEENIISGDGHALLGGRRNSIFNLTDEPHIFEPGQEDEISFEQSVIGGGLENLISGDNSFIGGGNNNTIGINLTRASGTFGVGINTANANRQAQFSVLNSAIVGGRDNELYSSYGFIGGGYGNRMSEGSNIVKAFGNAIVGGRDNLITGDSTLGTVILGGRHNEGRAPYTVIGGYKSSGDGSYGVALGAYAYSNHDGAMVLADGTEPTEVLGAQSKNSVEKHSLNLFFENGTYVRNGDLYVSGDATVTGNLTVLGSFTLGDTTTDTLTSVGEIITTDYVSGISGYFGKVGIGSSTIDEDAILQVTKPDVADPSRTEVARFLAITAAGNTNSSLRVSSAVAGSQTSGRYVDLSVFDHNPTSRPLILQRDGGQVGIGTSIPDGAMLKVNGDASITGDLSVATDIYVGDKIRHLGDSDTYLEFSNDLIYLKAGDINLLELREVGTDYVAVGGLASNTADVDFYVNTEVAGQDYAFVVDAGLPAVGVNIAPGDAKGAALVVSGDASISGELRVSAGSTSAPFVGEMENSNTSILSSPMALTLCNKNSTDGNFIPINFSDGIEQNPAALLGVKLESHGSNHGSFHFWTRGADFGTRMVIDHDGGVGIGTNNPAGKFIVYDADSKFEVDPDNNRIRLRDNVFISGDVDVSGDIAAITSGIVADEGGYVSGSSGYFGKVGIGTTSIEGDARLTVQLGSADGTYFKGGGHGSSADQRQLKISSSTTNNAGDTHTFDAESSFGEIAFASHGVEALRMDSNGHIGIGVTTPRTTLHVDKASADEGAIITIGNQNNTDGSYCGLEFINSTAAYPRSAIFAIRTGGYNAELTFHTSADNHITGSAYPTATERMRIDHDGNVGIGTETPQAKLQVNGDASITGQLSVADDTLLRNPNAAATNDVATPPHIELIGAGHNSYYASRTLGGKIHLDTAYAAPARYNHTAGAVYSSADIVFSTQTSLTNRTTSVLDSLTEQMRIGGDGAVYVPGRLQISEAYNVHPEATLVVSGDASITGELAITEKIVHGGDADTYFEFDTDRVRIHAGGVELIDAREAGTDYVAIGGLDDNPDVNLLVGSAVNGIDYVLEVDAGSSTVGINCDPLDAKGAALVVSGDASITGSVTAVGQIRTAGGALATPSFGFTDDAGLGISRPTTQALNFITSSTERMRIDSAGDLMVGNTTVAPVTSHSTQKGLGFDISEGELEIAAGSVQGPLALGRTTAAGMGVMTDFRQASNTFGTIKGKSTGGNYGNLEIDATGHLLLQENGGNVGIGTSSPGSILHLIDSNDGGATELIIDNSAAAGSSDELTNIRFRHAGTTSAFIKVGREADFSSGPNEDSFLALWTTLNGSPGEKVRISSAGNVGIGTTNPSYLLHTYGATADQLLLERSNANDVELVIKNSEQSWAQGIDRSESNHYAISAGDSVAANKKIVIQTDGNVGIGTTSPDRYLHVHSGSAGSVTALSNSTAVIESSSHAALEFLSPSSKNSIIYMREAGGAYGYINYVHSTPAMNFSVGGGTNMITIDAAGHVGIGEETPTAKLQVNGDASITGELKTDGNVGINADPATHSDTAARNLVIKQDSGGGGITISTATNAGGNIYFADGTAGDSLYRGYVAYNHTIDTMIVGAAADTRFAIDATATQVTGELRVNGATTIDDNLTITASNHLFVSQYIKHLGDDDTFINFTSDEVRIDAGGVEMITCKEAGTDAVIINSAGVDMDFRVESQGNENMFYVDGGSNLVGFGTSSPSASYTVTVSGGLAADYKSFVISHPDPAKPDKDLAYGSSETDEHNVFVRGRTQGKVIDLPDYWPYLIHEESITVQLTPIGEHQEVYVESIKDNKILINNKKQNKINCFYLVHAERKDIGKLEVEPDKVNS